MLVKRVVIILTIFSLTINWCSNIVISEENNLSFYYSYEEISSMLENFSNEYPDIFAYYSLGKTYENRDIYCVKISDNVSVDEEEPEVLFMGGVHGCEWPGFQVVMYTIISFLENYTSINCNVSFTNKIRNIVNNSEIFFLPMVNPDGCEAMTRKNARPNKCIFGKTLFSGVDVNRNFGYKWDEFYKHPLKYAFTGEYLLFRMNVMFPFMDYPKKGNGCYRGPYPFSEKESQAVKQFIENHDIKMSLDYHTAGEIIMYPYFWTEEETPDEPTFESIAENISKINRYTIQKGSQYYSILGGSADWMYGEHNILAMGIELCDINGSETPSDEKHIKDICKLHLPVNIYFCQRALEQF